MTIKISLLSTVIIYHGTQSIFYIENNIESIYIRENVLLYLSTVLFC